MLASASCYGRAEDVLVHAVVIAELKFRHIERKIFLTDLMKRADHATLEDRPEAFDGVGMDCANHILPLCMIDDLVRIVLAKLAIAHPLIRNQQTYIIRYGFPHKASQGFRFDIGNDASHHIALALDCANDYRLSRASTACHSVTVAVMPVLGLPTDKGFIDLDDPSQLGHIPCAQGHSDAMAHVPGSLVRAEAHVAADLQGAHAFLTRQHQMGHLKPIQQRLVRVLKDRAADVREAIGRHGRALIALPMQRIVLQGCWIVRTATGALRAI